MARPNSRAVALACSVVLLWAARTTGQGSEKRVSLAVSAPAMVAAGKTATVTISAAVKPGFHIQSNAAKDPWYRTRLIVTPSRGFVVGKVTWPKATKARVGSDTLEVFSGKFAVRVDVRGKTAAPGTARLKITLDYQACDDAACFPPEKVEAEARIKYAPTKGVTR